MEQAGDTYESTKRYDESAVRAAQVGLLMAAAGAMIVVFDLFGLGIVGVVLTVLGAVMAARLGAGRGWFVAVAGGAALEVIARIVAEGPQVLGGWLAVLASLVVLIGSSLGFPAGEEE